MKVGEKYHEQDKSTYLKIMAIKDGYVMARWKGCYPFVRNVKEFERIISVRNLSLTIQN